MKDRVTIKNVGKKVIISVNGVQTEISSLLVAFAFAMLIYKGGKTW